jgi:hypothetical protein
VKPGGVVGIENGLRPGLFRVRIPIGARDFSRLEMVQTVSEVHLASYSMSTDAFYHWYR